MAVAPAGLREELRQSEEDRDRGALVIEQPASLVASDPTPELHA